jgi:signal transduction histidine kinase
VAWRVTIPAFWRTSTFRLTLIFAAILAVFSSILLAYLFNETIWAARREAFGRLNGEYRQLADIHAAGGIEAVKRALFERSANGEQVFYYLLAAPDGSPISGDFSGLPARAPVSGISRHAFSIAEASAAPGEPAARRAAIAIIGRQSDATSILVALDIEATAETARRLRRAGSLGAATGIIVALLGGILVSRAAAAKVRTLARLTEDVIAGDLSRRAPDWRSGDEYSTLASALNAMLVRLERLVQSARNAGDAIAHDLRTPLARVRNRLEDIAAHLETAPPQSPEPGPQLAAELAASVSEAIAETGRMLETFNAVLRLSQIEAGENGAMRRVDLADMAGTFAEFFEPAFEDAGLGFEAMIGSGLMAIADSAMMGQALTNLLDNATKYTPAGGAAALRARRRSDGQIEVAVVNTGPGIPEDQRGRVLERFTRLDTARNSPGSGLGLSLVVAVAERHQGHVELSDGLPGPDGPGLRVALVIPAA